MQSSKTLFVDVDTQVDFMSPQGNLYVPGAEMIVPNLERLFSFARARHVLVLSSVDAHSPNDPEFQQFPPHCVEGTSGQEKIPQTLLPQRNVLTNEKRPLPAAPEFSRYQQWIVEKQKFDVFTSVNAAPLLERLGGEQYVVFGVATDYCVKAAVLGLLRTGRPVMLVADAIRPVEVATGEAALREMQEAGARLVNTQDVLSAALAA